ncbi:response regulator [Limibacillus sp. MBR-115]|uniref:response regulator n=1 Tax=Limibacillus sp. MBR-115 TaxID=3156465 RepID=UPI003395A70D
MPRPIKILIVEDSTADAALILRELSRGGYETEHRQVAQASTFNEALNENHWDVILCDYTMPGFRGTEALQIARNRGVNTPFIFVSGTIGEETAVAAMRAGAQDYVVKDNLSRLVPAIERELRETEVRKDWERSEKERRAAEGRFHSLLDLAPDAIVATDDTLQITIFNRAAEAMFGFVAEEVVGMTLEHLLPTEWSHEDTLHRAVDFEAIFATGDGAGGRAEISGRRKDGDTFPAEVSIVRLVENGQTGLMLVLRDISERKRAEATLRKLSSAVHHSASLIMITDRDGVIEYANPSLLRKMNFTEEEVVGKKPSIWKSGKTKEAIYNQLWKTILAGMDWHGELENKCADGRSILVSATVSPVKDSTGEITNFISIQEDVTETRAIQRQLQQAQKMEAVGQLTGGIAHDFNNLLSIVITNLDSLIERLHSPAALELATEALHGALHGADLIKQMLAFSRSQTLDSVTIDVRTLLESSATMLQRTLGELVDVRIRVPENLWPCVADRSQLETAILNLAINGRDAMPGGGTLTVEASNAFLDEAYAALHAEIRAGNYVKISISDTGCGIPADDLARIIEPFFTTKEPGKGTGLGLSMVHGFAKQSAGHLNVYSELGHGTTVSLYLPRAIDESEGDTDSLAAPVGAATGSESILVVDDNPSVRKAAVMQLTELGYQVMEAVDAKSALEIIEANTRVDLLFTDVIMPGGLTGFDLANEASRLQPDIKIILVTGFAEAAFRDQISLENSVQLLTKPYRKQELALRVRQILDAT